MLYRIGFWFLMPNSVNSNCCLLYWKHCFPLAAFKTVFPAETLVMRILDLLKLSHRYLKICLFFSIYFLSFVQLDSLYWSVYTDLYWSIELLVYWIFLIISILLLSPSKLIFHFGFFLFLKLQFGSFCIKCFSNETVHPSIHFEGLLWLLGADSQVSQLDCVISKLLSLTFVASFERYWDFPGVFKYQVTVDCILRKIRILCYGITGLL